ncbi:MAG: GNAT family N-acetyltransferase [Pseudomonadota bacterium]
MAEDFHIRLAVPRDSAALVPLVEQYWRFEAIEGFDAVRVTSLLEQVLKDAALGRAWIAAVDGKPAGYLLAVFVFSLEFQGLTAEIDELFVVERHRSLGLGGQLLDAAEAHFRAAGCTHVALQIGRDNEAARAFYQRRGFAGRSGFELVSKPLTGS